VALRLIIFFFFFRFDGSHYWAKYRGADKSLARPASQSILFDGEIFRLMLVLLYI